SSPVQRRRMSSISRGSTMSGIYLDSTFGPRLRSHLVSLQIVGRFQFLAASWSAEYRRQTEDLLHWRRCISTFEPSSCPVLAVLESALHLICSLALPIKHLLCKMVLTAYRPAVALEAGLLEPSEEDSVP